MGPMLLIAMVMGVATGLPISQSGHAFPLTLWLGRSLPYERGAWVFSIAAASALLVVTGPSTWRALVEGLASLSRPSLQSTSEEAQDALFLAVATLSGLLASLALSPLVETWSSAPVAIGIGLLATAAALGSTAVAPVGDQPRPTLVGAIVVGAAMSFGIAPGGAVLALGLTSMRWLGVQSARSFPLIAPVAGTLVLAQAIWTRNAASAELLGGETSSVVLGSVVAFVMSIVACRLTRRLTEKRALSWLVGWLVPLGLASLAFAYAFRRL